MKTKLLILALLGFLCSCSYKTIVHTPKITQITKSAINMYLIKENNQYLMIDCGTPHQGEKIEKQLRKHHIEPNQISHMIVTHGHYDHAGNAAYFQKKFKTKIIIGKGDLEMIQSHGHDNNLCPVGFFGWIGTLTKQPQYTSFTPDIIIDKRFNLSQIGFTGEIIPLAGHTQGSLIVKRQNVVFVGDLIRGSFIFPKIPKRHVFFCDVEDNNTDIQFVWNLDKKQTWYLGHGGPLTQKSVAKFLQKITN